MATAGAARKRDVTVRTRKPPMRATRAREGRPELTYRVGLAMARLTRDLLNGQRTTWSELAADLAGDPGLEPDDSRVHRKAKTAKRYLKGLRENLFIGGDVSLLRLLDRHGVEIVPNARGEIPLDRIREAELVRTRSAGVDDEDDDSPVAVLLPQYLAFALLQLLESVLPEDELHEVWERQVGKQIALGQTPALRNFRRKFLAIPFGEKVYRRSSESRRHLDELVSAIVNERVVQVEYRNASGRLSDFDLEPWSLVTYKSGLYVVGHSPEKEGVRFFAVERLEGVEPVRGEDGTPARFPYPDESEYDPAERFSKPFGIFTDPDGRETTVRLRIHDSKIAERIDERRFHETQKVERRGDGTWEMTMTVTGATEVEPWVLGWGPNVTVVEPADMRRRIEQQLRDTLALYQNRDGSV